MRTPDGRIIPWREMTPEQRFADQFRHFPTLLARWKGGRARLWSYTVSHNNLALRIEREGQPGCLEVRCSIDHLAGPVAWDDTDLQITHEPGVGIIVQDPAAGFRAVAATVSLAELGCPRAPAEVWHRTHRARTRSASESESTPRE